ncbi:hypothetical protein [Mariluticola halotolerans]|uniref:hypothetical protein n=1 Tax=Mariluticola halotolerans TaxID=2909283 RepID=UPI0026E14D6F|nr:hypothetical protein [Mariluticola halotolerans]UJQ93350.1 hypothetical protein L1P08_10105 [Mariluticola halotolerans]
MQVALFAIITAVITGSASAQSIQLDSISQAVVVSQPKGPYETTDGSAQVGHIIAEYDDGMVIFEPCNTSPFSLPKDHLRLSAASCAEEPDGDGTDGIWLAIGSDQEDQELLNRHLNGKFAEASCEQFPKQVYAAIKNVVTDAPPSGTIYSWSSSNSAVIDAHIARSDKSVSLPVSLNDCSPVTNVVVTKYPSTVGSGLDDSIQETWLIRPLPAP